MAKRKSHKDVEFVVDSPMRGELTYSTFTEASANAIDASLYYGKPIRLDVLVYSEAGARWWMGDSGVEMYQEDPDASVFERFEISARNEGRVP